MRNFHILSVATVLAAIPALAFIAHTSTAQTDSPKPAAKPPEAAEPTEGEEDEDDAPVLDPMGPNAACYVCHMTFVFEELARTHLPEKITCIECHGLSAAHANDENIGATKPDITYKRDEIDDSCRKCHEEHDVPARDVVARYIERGLTNPKTVCTDCHGMHRIEHAEEEKEEEAKRPSVTASPQPGF